MAEPIRKSFEIQEEDFENLKQLAIEHNALAERGINAGRPTWRRLIKDIAKGKRKLEPYYWWQEC